MKNTNIFTIFASLISIITLSSGCSLKPTRPETSTISKENEVGTQDDWIQNHFVKVNKEAPSLDKDALKLALCKYKDTLDKGLTQSRILTIVDYTKSSGTHRLWVIDLDSDKVLFNELVAHGKNSGDHKIATQFSNRCGSNQSSLGLFLTGDAYIGKHGYSLNLNGLQKGVNDNALRRRVVMHGAKYVSEDRAKKNGHVGRSFGCLSVKPDISRKLIDTIKDGSVIFSYHPSLNSQTTDLV